MTHVWTVSAVGDVVGSVWESNGKRRLPEKSEKTFKGRTKVDMVIINQYTLVPIKTIITYRGVTCKNTGMVF